MSGRLSFVGILAVLVPAATVLAGGHDLVVVRPGGPNPSEEAQVQVSRLIAEIGARAGWEPGSSAAYYFNRAEDALAHIARDRPAFLLTTPGFFLSHGESLGLQPINQILIDGEDTHRFFVVARKGTLESLDDLAGGTLMGSPLAEPDFVERIVFQGKLDLGSDVSAEYGRALSSLRRLSRGEVSAVILDATEYSGLPGLPFADSIETVFSSRRLPNTGIFSLAGTADAAAVDALSQASRNFCAEGEGASICETYRISGFQTAPDGVFDALVAEIASGPASE